MTMQNPIEIMARAIDPNAFDAVFVPSERRVNAAHDLARSALAALEAAGWRLAPPVASEEMLDKSETMFRISRMAEPAYRAMHGAMKTWGG